MAHLNRSPKVMRIITAILAFFLATAAGPMRADEDAMLLPDSVEKRYGWSPLGPVVLRIDSTLSADPKIFDVRFSACIGADVWEPDDEMRKRLAFYPGSQVWSFAPGVEAKRLWIHAEVRKLGTTKEEKGQAELIVEFGPDGFVDAELRDTEDGAGSEPPQQIGKMERKAKKTPLPTPGKCPPSNQSQAPAMPHL